ncbi:MAG TPA: calcium/proton exchanger [Longimicrobiaceae bacterium]|jgi:Ca2+:H+ antiporter|nr:calcium/proton exchanger [Longimicrobiaceae bacterium]
MALAVAATVLAAALTFMHAGPVAGFVSCAAALSLLAMMVGHGTDQLGSRMGPGATGVLQSALGNLPELFVCIFALRAGLVGVVQAALVGSILANSLLVLGLALLVGGLKNGTQRFQSEAPRMAATLMMLAVAALAIPTLAARLHTPAAAHEAALSGACAVMLLVVFAASLPFSLRGDPAVVCGDKEPAHAPWPLWMAIVVLVGASVGAAFVSDWFVEALGPAMKTLGISETFSGLVVVAIAGNAVENVVGVQLAARNRPDYAMSVVLNGSLQIALALIPVLVLISFFVGPTPLTLVMPPLMVAAMALTAVVSAFIVYDGESIWLEGVALIGLYGIIVSAFWWG